MRLFGILGLALGMVVNMAQGAIVMSLNQVGDDVVLTATGSANTAALSYSGDAVDSSRMSPSSKILVIADGPVAVYGSILGPSSFGTGSFSSATQTTGDTLGIYMSYLVLPVGYISGTQLSGSAIWEDTDLATLGVNIGTFKWTWGTGPNADSITLVTSTVPEPSTAIAFGAGLFLLVAGRRVFRRS